MFRIVFFDDLCHRGVSRICHTCARRVRYSFVVMREARDGLSFHLKPFQMNGELLWCWYVSRHVKL
jgi:hypothetical protein